MQCKIFFATNRKDLEEKVNTWLQTHPVSPDSMRFAYSSECIEDSVEYKIEHTLVLFYIPTRAI